MKKYIVIGFILGTLFSCTKTINFNDEEMANQVVVNSIISPDTAFVSYISKSRSILQDRQNDQAATGSMDLYEDGNLIKQFPEQTGAFSDIGFKPQAGKTYRMVISSEGKTLEAETRIPNQAEVVSVDTLILSNEFGEWTNYKVKIKDPLGEDYYRLVVMYETLSFHTSKDSSGNDRRYYMKGISQQLFTSDDPVFKSLYNNFGQDVIDAGPANDYEIFTDDYFQGKEYSVQFQIFNGYHQGGYGGGGPGNSSPSNGIIYLRYIIHVQKLSKELFNYLKYLNLYEFYHDNPFSEPVPVYSNVENGVGIFAGFNDNTKFSFEKTYIPYSMDTIQVENGYVGGY